MTAELELQKKKQKLEEKIEKTAQEIFALGEGDFEKENHSAEWKTLCTKLADVVWRYAGLVFGKIKIENCTVEIMNCVTNSLHAFKCDAGNKYINYISAALKKEIRRAGEKQKVEDARGGVTLPEQKERFIKKMIRLAEACEKDIHEAETQEWLALHFSTAKKKVTVEEIRVLIKLYENANAASLDAPLAGEENFSLHEKLADEKIATPLDALLQSADNAERIDKIDSLLEKIDSVFEKQQDRTKDYISALVTRQLLEEFSNVQKIGVSKGFSNGEIVKLLRDRKIAETEKAQKLLEKFLADELPTQQDVAAMFAKDKTDASRAVKKFLEKLRESVNWNEY